MIDLQTLIACCILSFVLGAMFDQSVQWSAVEAAETLLDEADKYFDATVRRALRIIEIAEEEKEQNA